MLEFKRQVLDDSEQLDQTGNPAGLLYGSSLMDEYNPDHFVTPRSSGLRHDYFRPTSHVPGWQVWVILGVVIGAIVVACIKEM